MGVRGFPCFNFFTYNKKKLLYNTIAHNNPSERAVEVPIAIQFLKNYAQNKKILEVGNVLSYYKELYQKEPDLDIKDVIHKRDIIDKFEVKPGVLNVDLMDVHSTYDIIVSISTVEHIGQHAYGEKNTTDKEAPLKAIVKIYNLLNRGGKALITVPFGRLLDLGWLIQFNAEYVNMLLTKYGIPKKAVSLFYLKKVDTQVGSKRPRQHWIQCQESELSNTYYNHPFTFANGICVIQLNKIGPNIPLHTNSNHSPLSLQPNPVIIGSLYYSNFALLRSYDSNGWMDAEQSGPIFHGPYVELDPNRYQLRMQIEVADHGHFTLDITSEVARKTLWKTNFSGSTNINDIISLPTTEKNVEIRLCKDTPSESKVRIPSIFLSKINTP